MMFERMLDKEYWPNTCEIEKYIGTRATRCMHRIIMNIKKNGAVKIEIKFPFGNNYGWSYKISDKAGLLFYIFFERGAVSIAIQLKKTDTEFGKMKLEELSSEGRAYWENRYPCGDGGGWVHYRILTDEHFFDIGKFIMMKIGNDIEWNLNPDFSK